MQNKVEHTSIAGIQFETNKKLGYYLVNDEIYYNKFHALIEASKTNKPIKWFFNESTFVKFPWHIEPEESLSELYRQRAQQLRDKYDYIRVEASGGADSTTVIFSFLLNGIHLDEVVFRYPKSGEKDLTGDAIDVSCENTLSEWEFAAKPLLQWISTNYPATKITVHDYSDIIINNTEEDESWVFKTRHYLQPGHAYKHQITGHLDHKRLAERGLSICVIYGVDKPKVTVKDDKFFLYFMDGQANHCNPVVGEFSNVSNEFFYWSPDACKLLAKQAHTIKNWFEQPEHHNMQNILRWPNNNFAIRNVYEQVVKALVYPDYDLTTFQTIKPTNNIYNEMDYWFHHNFKDTKPYQVWESGIQYLLNNLNEEYIGLVHGVPSNIMMFETPLYYFGESSIPELTLPLTTGAMIKDLRVNPSQTHHHIINGKLMIY